MDVWLKLAILLPIFLTFFAWKYFSGFDASVLEGRRVVVTGASTGIGRQIALEYCRNGARLVVTARSTGKLRQLIDECNQRRPASRQNTEVHIFTGDMSQTETYFRLIQTANAALGGIDTLVLNHIMVHDLGPWRGSPENVTLMTNIFRINFEAYVMTASHGLPLLENSAGRIVVVSSVAGRIGQPYVAAYAASKHALEGFFSSLRQELRMRRSNVSVTVCVIGLIGTENSLSKLKKFGLNFMLRVIAISEPSDAARAILQGGEMRQRSVFFPFMETYMTSLFRDIAPELLDSFVRYVFTPDN